MKQDDLKARLRDWAEFIRAHKAMIEGAGWFSRWLARQSIIEDFHRSGPETLEEAATAITDLEALRDELGEALKPFADIRTQCPESIKLIQKNVDGMKPITITVTKAQMQTAVATLAKLEKARG